VVAKDFRTSTSNTTLVQLRGYSLSDDLTKGFNQEIIKTRRCIVVVWCRNS